MYKYLIAAVVVAGMSCAALPSSADAGGYRERGKYGKSAGGARVKGYIARRGGYSYEESDVVNTYGDSRGRYGAATSLRDPNLGRQTEAGPFDHGFFFDSGMGLHGGDSPYMN